MLMILILYNISLCFHFVNKMKFYTTSNQTPAENISCCSDFILYLTKIVTMRL